MPNLRGRQDPHIGQSVESPCHRQRAIVVDDEYYARSELTYLLKQQHIEVVAEADNAVDAIRLIEQEQPDLVFLDVDMPAIDGFKMVSMIDELNCNRVIFVTAHPQHAIRAFDANAVDYLMKPVVPERLQCAIEKAAQRRGNLHVLQADTTPPNAPPPPRSPERIPCEFAGTHYLLNPSDVIYAGTDTIGTVYLETTNGQTYHTDLTLRALEDQLPDMLRCHRQHLVRRDAIQSYRTDANYCGTLTLPTTTEVPISRRYMKQVKTCFQQ
ncbi:Transcriptional regulatory protein BtsR [BD1-7 clade bacterium]|uniref:Transcriptional regulatory protein BtsR n=1 Tax=BD1-7 clade bacterium TaxID=2029982 RepID=A0A5S9PDD7_9GAMM|nr:Transcriptional regulatory protein BtsR [BD1-7 clade bacterium]